MTFSMLSVSMTPVQSTCRYLNTAGRYNLNVSDDQVTCKSQSGCLYGY